jgi:hypothetical protein
MTDIEKLVSQFGYLYAEATAKVIVEQIHRLQDEGFCVYLNHEGKLKLYGDNTKPAKVLTFDGYGCSNFEIKIEDYKE